MASLSSAVGWRGAHVGAPTDPSAGGGERASLTTGERPWDRQRKSDIVPEAAEHRTLKRSEGLGEASIFF